MTEIGRVHAFGVWDAPITDDAVWLETVPTGASCMYCHEHFKPGENGAIMPNGFGQHRECSLRSVWGGIGHQVNHERYCHGPLGPDAGLSKRESSLLVWRHCVIGIHVTESELRRRRGVDS